MIYLLIMCCILGILIVWSNWPCVENDVKLREILDRLNKVEEALKGKKKK